MKYYKIFNLLTISYLNEQQLYSLQATFFFIVHGRVINARKQLKETQISPAFIWLSLVEIYSQNTLTSVCQIHSMSFAYNTVLSGPA